MQLKFTLSSRKYSHNAMIKNRGMTHNEGVVKMLTSPYTQPLFQVNQIWMPWMKYSLVFTLCMIDNPIFHSLSILTLARCTHSLCCTSRNITPVKSDAHMSDWAGTVRSCMPDIISSHYPCIALLVQGISQPGFLLSQNPSPHQILFNTLNYSLKYIDGYKKIEIAILMRNNQTPRPMPKEKKAIFKSFLGW